MPIRSRDGLSISGQGARLDSWKEIAAHLGRSGRTVKRWETERGLPVYRVPGGSRGSVYAFAGELDEWLLSRSDPGQPESEAEADSENPLETPPASIDVVKDPPQAAILATSDAAASTQPEVRSPRMAGDRPQRRFLRFAGWAFVPAALLLGFLLAEAHRWRLESGAPHDPRLAGKDLREVQPNTRAPVSDPDRAIAHDLYLKGRYEWSQRTPDSLNRALDDFTQSIVHDPNYAEAYAGLAETYCFLHEYSALPAWDAYPRASAAARKAVALNDQLSEAHRALAFAELYGDWDFAEAHKEFLRAIELNPKDAEARRWFANAFAFPGHYRESLEQIDKAEELDPSSQPNMADKGWMLYNAGREDEGFELLKEVERSAPEFRSPHEYLMQIALNRKDFPAYLAEGRKTADLMKDPMLQQIIDAAQGGYARAGGRGLLDSVYSTQRKYYAEGRLGAADLAETCVLLDRKPEALELLKEGFDNHRLDILAFLSNRILLSLRAEPGYEQLIRKINLPQAMDR